MIAYVFCHWKKAHVAAAEYEARQREFHAALEAAPPAGFLRSFSAGTTGAPWAAGGGESYEDWYLVEDFGALGSLNEGAVTGARSGPHNAAAAPAEGGSAGIYALRQGSPLPAPRFAHWFGKPAGMTYEALLARLAPLVDSAKGALWMRQMTLGPAREFCVHTPKPVSFPSPFDVLRLPLRQGWPASPS